MKLRLTGDGFQNYTGQMGVIYFQDGVSINEVLPVDGMRIAGTIGAIWEDGSHANIGDVYAANLQTPAPTGLQEARLDHLAAVVGVQNAAQAIDVTTLVANAQFKAEGVNVVAHAQPAAAPADRVVDNSATTVDVKYTRAQLEAVVDEGGLTGLREIGTQVGVKAGSINDLIDRILEVAGEAE
ncbi:hypothetical protein ACNAUY_08125 [Acinetobacter tibetensis]|uniref:hypothetical protein n=1 Tax=Acinetobacter tibetensis TaxID=2943497 RepID=UPI003A4D9C29